MLRLAQLSTVSQGQKQSNPVVELKPSNCHEGMHGISKIGSSSFLQGHYLVLATEAPPQGGGAIS